ncbi:hypothetical protein [Chamaesiphon minutus]|uniref:Uncharacterized protein n=1 Tax=Chamaesiphon minutus (strain ATCC 27169 / PCC 6605) TaxID=1173020 RepID=K9UGD2_CHAP6|nr:hypothetical protein [Chamaesiphon minutus]AFY93486.1 hypothetical protein Cha6605_2428 [Chamaesiphon minutus PCC 6605]
MPRTVVILDETPDSQRLGVAMLGAIGELVDSVQFVAVAELPAVADPKTIYCPLTLDVPPTFEFWGRAIGRSCQEIERLRDLVATTTDVKVGDGGNLWLPVIWTAQDPIYGEVIGGIEEDRDRQPIQRFGERLLTELSAPPATYLVQFDRDRAGMIFDRLFPFPAVPAIGSIGQQLDLFACHWRCITHQSIVLGDANMRSIADE